MKICYLGIYQPVAPRDKIFLEGLAERGAKIEVVTAADRGLGKFWQIIKKGWRAARSADLVWVGYTSGILMPVAKIFGRKIVWNALNSMSETYIEDRRLYRPWSLRAFAIWIADFLAFHLATLSLVESEAQKRYISTRYFVAPKKLAVIYTGTDENVFYPDPVIAKNPVFTVVFRGMFLPATGVKTVIQAAALLKNENINFVVSGWGEDEAWVKSEIARLSLARVKLNTVFLPPAELRQLILSSHIMLGQFSKNLRLDRTIQHKTFEALALGMPYITRDSESNRELLADGENCLFVPPENPAALVKAILRLKADANLRAKLSLGARDLYERRCSAKVLAVEASEILTIL